MESIVRAGDCPVVVLNSVVRDMHAGHMYAAQTRVLHMGMTGSRDCWLSSHFLLICLITANVYLFFKAQSASPDR